MRSPRSVAAGLTLGLLALGLQDGAVAEGTLPDQTWSPDQANTIISPPMGGEAPHNQSNVVDGYLLLAGNGSHELWDIADPTRPEVVSAFQSPHRAGEAESHQVAFHRDASGRTLAVMISGRGVDLWDLSEASAPELLSASELEGIDYGDNSEAVWGVAWQGAHVFVGGTNTGLHVLDVSDPRAPSVVAHLSQDAIGGVSAGPLFALGNLLVITTPKNRAGVATLDISDPASPALLDFVLPEVDSYIGGFYGAHAYLLTPLRAYDVTTDPTDIELVASTETPDSEYVSFGDGFLFLGSMRPNSGAYKYDLSDLTAPVMTDHIIGRREPLMGLFTDDQFTFPIGNLLVLSDDEVNIGSVIAVHDAQRDTRPPALAYSNPADGATGLPPSTRIGLSFTDQIDLRSVSSETLVVRPVGGEPIAGTVGHQQTLIHFSPDAPLEVDTTYEIVLAEGGVSDLVGNALANDTRVVFSTGADVRAPTCRIEPTTPAQVDAAATLSAADAGPGATYAWTHGDETSAAASDARATSHVYAAPGRYPATLTVTTPDGRRRCSATQVVHRALTPTAPTHSSTLAIDEARRRVWTVNPDGDTVAAVDMDSLALVSETSVGASPQSVAIDGEGRAWVTCAGDDALFVLTADGSSAERVAFPYGASPYGVALTPDGTSALVTLEGSARLARVDVATRELVQTLDFGPDARGLVPRVRGIAITHDGARALVTRAISPLDHGEVYAVDLASFEVEHVVELAEDPGPDASDAGRGVPNYLNSVVISPDGLDARLPSNKANTARGLARDGEPLDPDNTVRTIVSALDLGALDLRAPFERLSARIDLDDHDSAFAAAYGSAGTLVFVTSQGTNRVDVFDAFTGRLVTAVSTGLAPRGLELGANGRLYVQDFMSRTLSVFDASAVLAGTGGALTRLAEVSTQAVEQLTPEVLLGKQIFYNADNPQMSQDGYLSCATCHLDGGSDGRVWDFTDRGEGVRLTIDLRGRAGATRGPVHWTGNFDEIQDFENDMRLHFGGSGLMEAADFEGERRDPLGAPKAGVSARLDALAAYVESLDVFPRSPQREPDGSMSARAREGRVIFESLDCLRCHSGPHLSDSAVGVLHDVGTLTAASGQRRGEPLEGLDTPTLRGLARSAPYLHDGSRATLREVLRVEGHGNAQDLSEPELERLEAFLLELDNDALGFDASPRVDALPRVGCASSSARPRGGASWLLLALVIALRRRRDAA